MRRKFLIVYIDAGVRVATLEATGISSALGVFFLRMVASPIEVLCVLDIALVRERIQHSPCSAFDGLIIGADSLAVKESILNALETVPPAPLI